MFLQKKFNIFFIISILLSSIYLKAAIDYLDTTFGTSATGIVSQSIGTSSQVNGLAIDSNGKIIAAGSATITEVQNLAIARFNSTGTLDTTFNTTGYVTALPSGTTQVGVNAVTTDASNNVIVAGFAIVSGASNIFVARYTSSGAPDTSFGSGGFFYNLVGDGDSASSVLIDANGKIVVSGSAVISGQNNVFVTRLNSDGTLDSGFNSGNVFTITGSSHYVGTSLKLDLNAKVVVAGSASTLSGTDFLVIRLNTNGTLDTTFNSAGSTPGVQVTNLLGNANNNVHSIVVDSSNRVIASGSTAASSSNSFALVRYASDGTVDTTFGINNDGIVTTAIGADAIPYASLIDQSGNIVLTGYSDDNFTTARYTANGSLDTTFGVSGIVNSAININAQGYASALQSSDGRVVAGGFNLTNETSGNGRVVLLRYNKNNTDFINITSPAANSTITTKAPTISGTSSEASASVQVYIDDVLFTTTSTNGSGNWTVTSNALTLGSHKILVNLVVSSVIVVSEAILFTIIDTLGEDTILAYTTTTQTTTATGFQTITFNNLVGNNNSIWTTPNSSTLRYISPITGKFLIFYAVEGGVITPALGATFIVSVRTLKNGTEITGSQSNTFVNAPISTTATALLTNSLIVTLSQNDTIQLQYAKTTATDAGIISGQGNGTTRPAATVNIIRLQ